jgi:hypothetical protein
MNNGVQFDDYNAEILKWSQSMHILKLLYLQGNLCKETQKPVSQRFSPLIAIYR